MESDPLIGQSLSHYRIVARLGAGGMGVVYRAQDIRLDRPVALKFLRSDEAGTDLPQVRLLREARNASALNHPHIATIYEVGESDGRAYIAMEFVEGRPLSAVIGRDPLAPETAVRYGLEIAAALGHAHERGIVHRDLKPGNVMITTAGSAKVLDFGLAKRLPDADLGGPTASLGMSEEGSVSGTLLYMAPETLRGEPADARTDLWALGALLYEMATGQPPFEGRTAYEISAAILREPLKPFSPEVPLRLQAVIQRCLSKEREHRYQRASEVHAALETIGADALTPPSATTSRATVPALPSRASRRGLKLISVAGAVALALLAWGGYELFGPKPLALSPTSSADWVQLTDFSDSVTSPALSPDGKMLAFIHGPDTFFGRGEIEAKVLPNGDPVELTHDGKMKMSPEFSPDGSTIAYTVYTDGAWDTWSVPVLGGDARKTFTNVEGLQWIDADHLLFSQIISGTHMSLVTSGAGGEPRRDVYVPPRERGMAHRSAVSPDHKWVLLAGMDNGGWLPCRLVPFDGPSAGQTVGPPDAACTHVAWSPDGKWMYLNSESGGRFHIWRQRYPDGKPEQLTSGATEEEGLAIAPDGKSLITSVGLRESTIWIQDGRGEHQLSTQGFAENPHFSRDGKKLYYLVRRNGLSGQFVSGELWVADLASDHSERALRGFEVTGFDVSRDGKEAVFSATDEDNVPNLWLASLDLQFSPRRFASAVSEDQPRFDDANGIYFRATEGNRNFLYRMNADGSDRRRAYPKPILEFHSLSPDGKWATVWAQIEGTEAQDYAVPLEGGDPVELCTGYCGGRWSADGKVFFIQTYAMEGAFTMLVNVPPGGLPAFPPGGVRGRAEMERVPGAKVLVGARIPSPIPGLFASQREEVHRNLYRIPLQ